MSLSITAKAWWTSFSILTNLRCVALAASVFERVWEAGGAACAVSCAIMERVRVPPVVLG